MATSEDGRRRCEGCRYWLERCCHALAVRDKNDYAPLTCRYFISETSRPVTWVEQASC